MYYFNILEPKIICEDAVRFFKQELTRISMEIEKLKAENEFESHIKIQELKKMYIDYYQLIYKLEQLGEFGVQQMNEIVKNKKANGECIV